MAEKIPEQKTENVTNNYFIKDNKVSAEVVINKALWFILCLLILSVIATFFVEELPKFVLNLRSMAIDGIWIMVCCYSIGEVLKRIFQNKGKGTEEYKKAKADAQAALNSLTAEELAHRDEYCAWYETEAYNRLLLRKLLDIGVSKEDYKQKYAHLSKRELSQKYGGSLTKKQVKKLSEINKIERAEYDSSFFLSETYIESGMSPSQMYNTERADVRNMITSAITTTLSSFGAVAFAGSLVLSFSLAVLFSAIVKLTITAVFGAFKARFGWNLSMRTDIGRYLMQVKEVANLKNWYVNIYPALQKNSKENCS